MKTMRMIFGLALLAAVSACTDTDDSPCGPKQTYDIYKLGHGMVDTSSGVYYSYLDGNERVFQWSNIVENVCPEEHVQFEGRVALLDETTTGISARAGMSWQFFFERNVVLTKTGADLKGSDNAGLKQAFDKDTAWFIPKVEVFFPTKGNYHADTTFLLQNVISVELMAHYREFK